MLITAAPLWIAVWIWLAEREQVIASGSGTLSARAPGHTPTIPTPLTGAAATEAVAVPCELVTANCGSVAVLPPANSGWLLSSWASTSAISGLVGRHGRRGEGRVGDDARQASGGTDSGSRRHRLVRLGERVRLRVDEQAAARSAPANARARPRATT